MAKIDQISILCDGVEAWNAFRADQHVAPDLTHIEVRHANFAGIDFQKTDFDGASFSTVDFRNANFQHARLNGINASRCRLDNANLRYSEFKGTDFKRVNFRHSDLTGCEAFELKIRHCDLQHCVLDNARLRFTHIYNCDVHDLSVNNLNLDMAVMKRVVSDAQHLARLKSTGFVVELENQPTPSEWPDWDQFNTRDSENDFGRIIHQGKTYWINEGRWDFFISHASTVKETLARPLAAALKARDQRVWFDDLQIKAGDDLGHIINLGVKGSLFGVILISEDFFGRRWTEAELDLLSQKRIFLVLHGIEAEALAQLRPGLQDRFCIDSRIGVEAVAEKLIDAIRRPPAEIG